jgi:hypothetical protein
MRTLQKMPKIEKKVSYCCSCKNRAKLFFGKKAKKFSFFSTFSHFQANIGIFLKFFDYITASKNIE